MVKVVWLLIVGVGCGHPLIGGPACRAWQALAVTCEEELASSWVWVGASYSTTASCYVLCARCPLVCSLPWLLCLPSTQWCVPLKAVRKSLHLLGCELGIPASCYVVPAYFGVLLAATAGLVALPPGVCVPPVPLCCLCLDSSLLSLQVS